MKKKIEIKNKKSLFFKYHEIKYQEMKIVIFSNCKETRETIQFNEFMKMLKKCWFNKVSSNGLYIYIYIYMC